MGSRAKTIRGLERAWDIGLLVAAAAFAGGIQLLPFYLEGSRFERFLVADDPTVFFLTYGLLPGAPFVFSAWRAVRHAKTRPWHYRATVAMLIAVLGIVSFAFLAWFVWFGVNVIYRGGEL